MGAQPVWRSRGNIENPRRFFLISETCLFSRIREEKIRGARFVGAKRDYSRDERRFAIIHLTEILVGCQRRPHALHKALTE